MSDEIRCCHNLLYFILFATASFDAIFEGTDVLMTRVQLALCAENGSPVSADFVVLLSRHPIPNLPPKNLGRYDIIGASSDIFVVLYHPPKKQNTHEKQQLVVWVGADLFCGVLLCLAMFT